MNNDSTGPFSHPRVYTWIFFAIGFIVLLIIGLGSMNIFFADKYQISQYVPTPTLQVMQTAPESPQPSVTTKISNIPNDWEIYTDTYVTIRYPKSWKIQMETKNPSDIEQLSIFQSPTENDGTPLGNSYQIHVMSNNEKDSLSFAKQDISQNWQPSGEPIYSRYSLGNLDATLVTELYAGKGAWGPSVYIVSKNLAVQIIAENVIPSNDAYFNNLVRSVSFSN